jgi:diacylglycerol O-acyltransferase/trehalose O-mycolyltransferase
MQLSRPASAQHWWWSSCVYAPPVVLRRAGTRPTVGCASSGSKIRARGCATSPSPRLRSADGPRYACFCPGVFGRMLSAAGRCCGCGCCDTYRSWTRSGGVERLLELRRVLVAMPEAGEVSFYSDRVDGARGGPARWETFHLTELRRLLERDWRAGKRRAVAVVSIGGFRRDGLRRPPSPDLPGRRVLLAGCLIPATKANQSPGRSPYRACFASSGRTRGPVGRPPGTKPTFGHSTTPAISRAACATWICSSRSAMVERVISIDLGRGRGRGKSSRRCYRRTSFAQRLARLGIPVRFDAYSPGTHGWRYWRRALRRSLPMLVRALEPRP